MTTGSRTLDVTVGESPPEVCIRADAIKANEILNKKIL